MTNLDVLRKYGLNGIQINTLRRAGYETIESLLDSDGKWKELPRVGRGIIKKVDMAVEEWQRYRWSCVPWRVGRSIGRTIYARLGTGYFDINSDIVIGMMDTPELAAEAVSAHNSRLRKTGVLNVTDDGIMEAEL